MHSGRPASHATPLSRSSHRLISNKLIIRDRIRSSARADRTSASIYGARRDDVDVQRGKLSNETDENPPPAARGII